MKQLVQSILRRGKGEKPREAAFNYSAIVWTVITCKMALNDLHEQSMTIGCLQLYFQKTGTGIVRLTISYGCLVHLVGGAIHVK